MVKRITDLETYQDITINTRFIVKATLNERAAEAELFYQNIAKKVHNGKFFEPLIERYIISEEDYENLTKSEYDNG